MTGVAATRPVRRTSMLDEPLYVAGLAAAVVRAALRPGTWRAPVREALAREVHATGVRALGPMAAIAAMVGLGVVLQTRLWLLQFGQSALVGQVLVVVVVRELAPLLVNLLVIVRSGTRIATELGTMSVRGEIDALIAQGIDPLQYLLVPRVVALMVAVPCLTLFFDAIAFATGYAASVLLELRPPRPLEFVDQVLAPLGMGDVVGSLLKCVVPALLVGILCCHAGLLSVRTPTAVPRAAAAALLRSVLSVFLVVVLVTAISYP